MLYGLMADLVLVAHLAFVAFVALGGLLAWRWPRLAWIHIPVALWGAAISYVGFTCPLTPLENWLRKLGGRAGYQGGFIEHYVTALLYPAGLTREAQLVLGTAVLALNLVVYWRVLAVSRRERGRAARGS
ncbi:MAG: DUF2784 domain-containing protein [Candidatus Rokubacteria bacterium]|nr:DUF2784 domain-containing protein [Candidatus Rokubacteria bacterium]